MATLTKSAYSKAKRQRARNVEPGAYVHSERHQTVEIVGKRGRLLLDKREADTVLANLQVMYYWGLDNEGKPVPQEFSANPGE